jgi:hypothetical protein
VFLPGDCVEQLLRDAGFVDLTTREFQMDIGDWGPGFSSIVGLTLDVERYPLGRECMRLLILSIEAMVMANGLGKFCLRKEDRGVFMNEIKQNLGNPNYQLFSSL